MARTPLSPARPSTSPPPSASTNPSTAFCRIAPPLPSICALNCSSTRTPAPHIPPFPPLHLLSRLHLPRTTIPPIFLLNHLFTPPTLYHNPPRRHPPARPRPPPSVPRPPAPPPRGLHSSPHRPPPLPQQSHH